MNNQLKTNFWLKPIPYRGCDWEAWFDDREEIWSNGIVHAMTGFGATENQAVTNLLMQWCDVWAARGYEGSE